MANGAAFQPEKKLEQKLAAELNAVLPGQHEIVVHGSGEEIRSEYIRWYILQAIPVAAPAITRFELVDATVIGEFDLRGSTVGVLLRFVDCIFQKTIRLTDAKIIGLDFVAGTIEKISGDRLTAEGSVRLLAPKFVDKKVLDKDNKDQIEKARTGTRVKQVRLCGATIRGNLDLRGSRIGGTIDGAPVSPSLFADGITVNGNVLLCKRFVATGEICLNGATIARNLDCSAATLLNSVGYSLSAAGAQISGSVLLCRPYWREKDDDDDDITTVFSSVGTVRLEGAKISGNLNCSNSRFCAAAFLYDRRQADDTESDDDLYAIKADGLDVGADLIFGSDDEARKHAIHSDIRDAESTIRGADGSRYDIHGVVGIINAKVGGDLLICDTRFHFPGEETFCADGITVTGSTFLDNSYSNGVLRFVQATLKQGLSVKSVEFDVTLGSRHWLNDDNISEHELDGPACGIYASFAQIGGTFTWQDVKKLSHQNSKIQFWLNISGATGSAVEDSETSWATLDRFDITGSSYTSISNLTGPEYKWRLRELDRQYAPLNRRCFTDFVVVGKRLGRALFNCNQTANDGAQSEPIPEFDSDLKRQELFAGRDEKLMKAHVEKAKTLEEAVRRFKPQPYLQLARTFRAAGYVVAAREVLVRLERNQTRYGDYGVFRMVWRWILDGLLRYGHSVIQPIGILAFWALVSALCFEFAYHKGQIVLLKDGEKTQQVSASGQASQTAQQAGNPVAAAKPAFNSLIYAIDTLLPIVDLNQKKNWTVDPLSKTGIHTKQLGAIGWSDNLAWLWRQIPDVVAPALLIFNTFFGWLMTTLFVAGVTGLMRTGRDS